MLQTPKTALSEKIQSREKYDAQSDILINLVSDSNINRCEGGEIE